MRGSNLKKYRLWLKGIAISLASCDALAQAPGGGQLLDSIRDRTPVVRPPVEKPVVVRPEEIPPDVFALGTRVVVRTFSFTGNMSLPTAVLEAELAELIDRELDIAGLQAAVTRITNLYRSRGFMVARAYLPPQEVKDGQVTLAIQEGVLGETRIERDDRMRLHEAKIGAFLDRLYPGMVLHESEIERALLLLADIPGVVVNATLRPGKQPGSADLIVRLTEDTAVAARVTTDNYGDRHTGRVRLGVDLSLYDQFGAGEQFTLRTLTSFEGLNVITGRWSAPVGGSGLRAGVDFTHLDYKIGRELSSLRANGTASAASLWLSYPLVRTRSDSLWFQLGAERKRFVDNIDSTDSTTVKSSDLTTLGLHGNLYDRLFLGGGRTAFGMQYGMGELKRESAVDEQLDAATAKSAGHFKKSNLNLSRLQWLDNDWSLYGAFAGQLASKNLDSSEKFYLGGPLGVRAYSQGSGVGDQGWLATLELRKAIGSAGGFRTEGFVFYDAGRVSLDRHPWDSSQPSNRLKLAGPGVGLSVVKARALSASMGLAFRTNDTSAVSEQPERRHQIWAQVSGAPQHLAALGSAALGGPYSNGLFGLYGSLGVIAERVERDGATEAGPRGATQSATPTGRDLKGFIRLRDPTSYIGARGTLPLSQEVGAFWQLENGFTYSYNKDSADVPAADSSTGSGLRDSAFGLRDKALGSLFYGKWDMPAKELTQAFDPFGGNTIATHTNIIGSPGFGVGGASGTGPLSQAADSNNDDASFNRRQSGVWQYWSQKFYGASFRLAYSDNRRSAASDVDNGRVWGASANWQRGALKVGAAYEQHRNYFGVANLGRNNRGVGASSTLSATSGTSSRDWNTRVGVGYRLQTTELSLILDRVSYKEFNVVPGDTVPDLSSYARNAWWVGVTQPVGRWELRTSYGAASPGRCQMISNDPRLRTCDTDGLGARMFAAGFNYRWTKAFSLFGHYAVIRNQPSASYNFGVGSVFARPGQAPGVGADPQGYGIGVKYSF